MDTKETLPTPFTLRPSLLSRIFLWLVLLIWLVLLWNNLALFIFIPWVAVVIMFPFVSGYPCISVFPQGIRVDYSFFRKRQLKYEDIRSVGLRISRMRLATLIWMDFFAERPADSMPAVFVTSFHRKNIARLLQILRKHAPQANLASIPDSFVQPDYRGYIKYVRSNLMVETIVLALGVAAIIMQYK